jgi:hypothetical protein
LQIIPFNQFPTKRSFNLGHGIEAGTFPSMMNGTVTRKMDSMQPIVVAISGLSSNVGKSTLMCELLRRLPDWEAIKVSRGHYRSCGKDPAGCCVSDLLGSEPVIRSGRESNYQAGKDTGRFWDAGATNVHWVLVKDDQVERGIAEAIARVKSRAVLIEGNSFLQYLNADLAVMCARSDGGQVKSSARKALECCDVLYLSSLGGDEISTRKNFAEWHASLTLDLNFCKPIVTRHTIEQLVERIRLLESARGYNSFNKSAVHRV